MTDEEPGLENAFKHMEAALECLVDPKDQVVAIRLSHALDLARKRLLEGARGRISFPELVRIAPELWDHPPTD